MPSESPKKQPKTSANRRNLYFKNPLLFDALQMAVKKGVISARSGSDRVEQLLRDEVRRLAPKFRKNGIPLPEGTLT